MEYISSQNGDNGVITVFFNWVRLINLAIYPPSIITAFVHPPSTSAVEFCYSETRACLYSKRRNASSNPAHVHEQLEFQIEEPFLAAAHLKSALPLLINHYG